ncbi:hypothetical protein [Okeania sp. SIO2B3]|uniref:hypothetical protein n=1 Tax=Okeania sp. SIO2B3 TaxID=2607784 RepID=UPI0013C08239|nr:hypothetical protein [Okeania sp. SIO2B3]NET41414.1 hypothetical protein [Okeania sp. SIO2B3]
MLRLVRIRKWYKIFFRLSDIAEGRRKKEEGRRKKKEEGRKKKEEGKVLRCLSFKLLN